MPFRKMDCVAEVNNVPQKIGPMAEALQDAGNFFAARFCAPLVINLGHLAGGIIVLDELIFVLGSVMGLQSAQFSGEYHNIRDP